MAASVPIERRKHVSACEEVAVLCAVCCVLCAVCVCVRARAFAAVRVMRARVHHGRHARARVMA